MHLHPTILFQDAPLEDPVEEFPAAKFFHLSGFWCGQFNEVAKKSASDPKYNYSS